MTIHIGYFVTSRAKMAEFYQQVAGFNYSHSFRVEPGNMIDLLGLATAAQVDVLELGPIRIELIELDHPLAAKTSGIASGIHHLGLKLANAAQIVERARRLGRPVKSTFRVDHTTHYIEDPEGNIVEVSEAPQTTRE